MNKKEAIKQMKRRASILPITLLFIGLGGWFITKDIMFFRMTIGVIIGWIVCWVFSYDIIKRTKTQ